MNSNNDNPVPPIYFKYDFENKIILVTGGSGGIGSEIVKGLISANARVVFTYFTQKNEALKLTKNLDSNKVSCYPLNINAVQEINDLINNIEEKYGEIFGLVNNAGRVINKLLYASTENDWNQIFNTNLNGVFNLSKAVIERMILRGKGKIVNISSISGERAVIGLSAYGAAKAALNSLTKSLALEYSKFNIQINAIAPGYIETRMVKELGSKHEKAIINKIPMKKYGSVTEISNLTMFLLSDLCNYLHGSIINCDGGLSCSL